MNGFKQFATISDVPVSLKIILEDDFIRVVVSAPEQLGRLTLNDTINKYHAHHDIYRSEVNGAPADVERWFAEAIALFNGAETPLFWMNMLSSSNPVAVQLIREAEHMIK